jgi:23S rRNA (cytidine1920-2'-O)/16S rRNA (cytidine1409-2'-O)-methyltransferase
MPFVSRGGEKLDHALRTFGINPSGAVCADFGSSTGGFVDCWLQHGAKKVYAVETGYGVLDWKLRNDERVVVLERTNAMHVELPELVAFISIDASWTRLTNILPNTARNLQSNGRVVALLKPHYEAQPRMLRKGKLDPQFIPEILDLVRNQVEILGFTILHQTESPIVGSKGGNTEFLLYLAPCQ